MRRRERVRIVRTPIKVYNKGATGRSGNSVVRNSEVVTREQRKVNPNETRPGTSKEKDPKLSDEVRQLLDEIRTLARTAEADRIKKERMLFLREYRRSLQKIANELGLLGTEKSPEEEAEITRQTIQKLMESTNAAYFANLVHGTYILNNAKGEPWFEICSTILYKNLRP